MAGSYVAENFLKVRSRIRQAAERAGRNPDEVQLLAVSKKQTIERITQLHRLGQNHFGENYLQEADAKLSALIGLHLQWHYIGALQSKKIKNIVGRFVLIQSVDRQDLAEEIAKRSQEHGLRQKILLQVNIGSEEGKSGVLPGDFKNLVASLAGFSSLQVEGVMCLPPLMASESEKRDYFRATKQLGEELRNTLSKSTTWRPTLSMGTTHDFELAIEEGSTLVRVGEAIFGARA